MIKKLLVSLVFVVFASSSAWSAESDEGSTLVFDKNEYFYRWSGEDLHEFTPAEQSVTGEWRDMLSINHFTDVSEPDELTVLAKDVLENYRANGGIVLGVDTLQKRGSQPAQYIMAVLFGAQEVAEYAVVRFQLKDGVGTSVTYAHREYGEQVGERINTWLEANGPRIKRELSRLKDVPAYSEFRADGTYDYLNSLQRSI